MAQQIGGVFVNIRLLQPFFYRVIDIPVRPDFHGDVDDRISGGICQIVPD